MRAPLVILLFVPACGGDGGGLPDGAATITVGAQVTSYGGFIWGKNNDCGATSVTIRGHQSDDDESGIGLCLPRPDLLGGAAVDLADADVVQLVGATATAAGCTTTLASSAIASGTVTFPGFSTASGASYQMTLAGQVDGTRTCASGPGEAVTMVLGGTVRIDPQP